MATAFILRRVSSLGVWSTRDSIDPGGRLVARHKPLAKIADKIFVSRFRFGFGDVQGARGELSLQLQPGRSGDDVTKEIARSFLFTLGLVNYT